MPGPAPIPRPQKKSAPTFLDAEYAGKVVDVVNALINLKITPGGAGTVSIARDSMTIDLSPLIQSLGVTNLSVGGNNNNIVQNIQNTINNLSQQINNLQRQISGAKIVCNGDGTISWIPGE